MKITPRRVSPLLAWVISKCAHVALALLSLRKNGDYSLSTERFVKAETSLFILIPLSSLEASLCHREARERNESARGLAKF